VAVQLKLAKLQQDISQLKTIQKGISNATMVGYLEKNLQEVETQIKIVSENAMKASNGDVEAKLKLKAEVIEAKNSVEKAHSIVMSNYYPVPTILALKDKAQLLVTSLVGCDI
jgi:hypothetical protein